MRTPQFLECAHPARTSANGGDALSHIDQLVDRAVELNQPALGLTDHGNMADSVEIYKACMKEGARSPSPGLSYFSCQTSWRTRLTRGNREKQQASRYHLGVLAYTTQDY